ncbi:MAG TPA: c-type cytochrome [Sphingomicrobium sp.]|nr:c-type cytochrome [Sphingomicrobium sp.]
MLSACSVESTPAADRFGVTGELIALSGAGAGAGNACMTCHGLNGRGDGAGVPRLASLDPGYLDRQLEDYAEGRRRHPEMSWIAGQLTARQRLAVSHYFAAMAYEPTGGTGSSASAPKLYTSGDPGRGIPACASCHGLVGQGLGPANPPLAGQPASYLAQQIHSWRYARRRNDPGNAMLEISQRLTDREAEVLAAYASGLSGDARRPKSAAASR